MTKSTVPVRCAAAIQNLLEDKLAEAVLDGEVKAGDEVTVTKGEDSLKFLSAEVIKN